LYRIPTLSDRLRSLIDRTLQCLPGFLRAFRQQISCRLKAQQQSVKALQQRIVQIPGNAGPLVDALFQAHVELPRHLSEAESMKRPEQYQKNGQARQPKPSSLVVRRGNGEIQECAGLIPHAAVIAGGHAEAVIARGEVRILPLELEAKVNLLGRNEGQCSVINRQIAD